MNLMTEEEEFNNIDSQRSMWCEREVDDSYENAKMICDKVLFSHLI